MSDESSHQELPRFKTAIQVAVVSCIVVSLVSALWSCYFLFYPPLEYDYIPPAAIVRGEPTKLSVRLPKHWVIGRPPTKYTLIYCYYRLSGERGSQRIRMTKTEDCADHVIVECEIPPFSEDAKGLLEYHFQWHADDLYRRREQEPIELIDGWQR